MEERPHTPILPFSPSQNTLSMVVLGSILLLAFVLRLYRLPDANIWWDEGLAVWAARQSPLEIARWTSADVHPPLYFWMLHIWRQFVGDSEFAVRFLSVGIGTLTVAAVWYLSRLLVPGRPWIAVTAALFVAMSRFAVWWSQETRMYMLGGLLVTLSLAFTVRLRQRTDWRAVAGYLISTIAALWTLYLLAFLLIIEGLYWLWTLRSREGPIWRAILHWAGLQAIVLLSFVPWLLYALPRMRSWSAQESFEPALFIQLYATLLTLGISTNVERYWLPALLIVGVVALGIAAFAFLRREDTVRDTGVSLLLLTLIVPPGIVWLVTMLPRSFGYTPHPEARYLLPFAPPFYLLVTLALAGITGVIMQSSARRWLTMGLMLVLLGIFGWSLRDYYAGRYLEDDYRSVALTLQAHAHPDDLIVLHTDDPWPIFAYHWPNHFEGTPHLQDADIGGAEYFLAPLWQTHDAIWLVINEDALRADPQRYYETWLTERAAARHEWRFGQKRVVLFAKTPARAETLMELAPGFRPRRPLSTASSDNMTTVGWEQPLNRIRAGDIAHLALYVSRQKWGGEVTVTLGNTPVATDTAKIPVGTGVARVPLHVRIPPDSPARELQWHAAVDGTETTQGTVQIVPADTPPPRTDASPEHILRATFGEPARIELLGYDLREPADSDSTLRLTLYWRARATLPISYKVFTHIINAEGRVEAQHDEIPVNGARPTTSWRPGEVIVDTYDISRASVPAGTYTLRAGFYDPATGDRLGPVRDATGSEQSHDQVTLTQIALD